MPLAAERLSRMHWWTLNFDDEELEQDLRRNRTAQCQVALSSISILLLGTGMFTRFGQFWFHYVCVALLIFIPSMVKEEDCRWLLQTDLNTFGSISWAFCWTVIIARFRWLTATEGYQDLGPDDTVDAIALCFMWMLNLISQRVMHANPWCRAVVIALGLMICGRNECWRHVFFSALFLGEVLGYVLERTIRDGFLHHMKSIEQLRREKERLHYELLMSKKQQESSAASSIGSQSIPGRGNASSSACSELASFLPCIADDSAPRCHVTQGGLVTVAKDRPGSADGSDAASACSMDSAASGYYMSSCRMDVLWRTLEQSNVLPMEMKKDKEL